jgi:hypothetical protein
MTGSSGGTSTASTRSRVNPRVWFSIFHEPRLMACLMEVLKNGFDWDAQVVRLITNESRNQLRHVDDGRGMNEANRESFLSVGYSTAGGDQSGTFGTGAKKIIFTFARSVRVVTAPADESDHVYIAEFTPLQLAEDYSGQPGTFWKRHRKTAKNWPHEHQFGTDIVYTLKDPNSRSIYRGDTLARKLSERLDIVLIENGMVLVDGSRLPSKRLKGRIFRLELPPSSPLGRVILEFYRPVRRSGDEDLRMTGRSIGEVSFRDVFVKQLLIDDLREMVPALFLEADVCGLIMAAFLNDHATERRDSYDAHVTDDERVVELLRLLKSVEAEVANYLGIKLRNGDDPEAASQAVVHEFIEQLQHRYNPDRAMPPGYAPDGSKADEDTASGTRTGRATPPSAAKTPSLVIERGEFAIGETIEVRLDVPDGSTGGFHFYLDQAHAKVEFVGDGAARLVAEHVGRGLIRAANPLTGQTAKIEYEVVAERQFHLSATGPVGIQLGAHFTVHAINADKLKGPLEWIVDGSGELQVTNKGLAARLAATQAGRLQITARDTADPAVSDSCEVFVIARHTGPLPFMIRGEFFVAEFTQTNLVAYRKPATIVLAGPGQVHRLVFNQIAPGFQRAVDAGTLHHVLAYATAVEFVKCFCIDWDDLDLSDLQSVLLEIENQAAELFDEMLIG